VTHRYDAEYEACMLRLDKNRHDIDWLRDNAVPVRFWGLYGGFRRWKDATPEKAYATAYSVTSQQYYDHPDMALFERIEVSP
jgi:hypothetical protein